MTSRAEVRRNWPADIRMEAAEGDIDKLEELIQKVEREGENQTKVLVGILITLVTSSLLLALNVVIVGA